MTFTYRAASPSRSGSNSHKNNHGSNNLVVIDNNIEAFIQVELGYFEVIKLLRIIIKIC